MSAFQSSTLQPFRKVVDGAMKWARDTPHPHALSMATAGCQEAVPTALKDLFCDENEVPNEGRVRARKSALQACLLEESSSPRCEEETAGSLGYKLGLTKTYAWGQELGRGANGIVRVVRHLPTDKEYACKTIPKVLGDEASETKKAGHLAAIAKEIDVMRKLSSCLNVAKLIDVFEDATHVHIISEWCKGGTLDEVVGKKHYSERTVASYMRGVLKTIAQCHANNIIHRDVKPGNFLLLSDEPDASIKAIDFGLAETFNTDDELPLTHLGMEGTPWFLAPETISSKWSPAADVWAAGVMAHQLLTGRMPFDDRRNPHNPVLTTVLRSILSDKLDFNKAYWADISDEAKDFIKKMLERDVKKRPTAREALQHPWLTGDVSDRQKGKQLNLNVVQRIQRYGRSSLLKRTVFEMIVSEVMDDVSPSGLYECTLDSKARALIDSPSSGALMTVLRYLRLHDKSIVDRDTVAKGLRNMGYRIADEELERLMEIIGDNPELLTKESVISSQMDWRHLQRNHTDHWIQLAKKAFSNIDLDGDGIVDVDQMITSLQNRLPAHEIEKAYADAVNDGLIEASKARRMDFASFMRLMRMPSSESLDLYDDRLEGTVRSWGDTSSSPNSSRHSSHAGAMAVPIGCSAQARNIYSHAVKRSSLDNLRHCSLSASMDPSTRHGTLHGSLATVFESNQN